MCLRIGNCATTIMCQNAKRKITGTQFQSVTHAHGHANSAWNLYMWRKITLRNSRANPSAFVAVYVDEGQEKRKRQSKPDHPTRRRCASINVNTGPRWSAFAIYMVKGHIGVRFFLSICNATPFQLTWSICGISGILICCVGAIILTVIMCIRWWRVTDAYL